jgi:outer membrane receptor protein involved in Fe transport
LVGRTAMAEDALNRQVTLEIPEHTRLEDALVEWGTKAGMAIGINTPAVEHQTTHGVRGTMRADTALSVLLRDSGLSYTSEEGRIRVVPATTLTRSSQRDPEAQSASPPSSGSETLSNPSTANDVHKNPSLSAEHVENEHSVDLEEIIVTAQKREERLQNVPISISVLSGTQLETPTITSVTEALSTVPGVATNQSYNGGGTVVTIRGVAVGQALVAGSSPVAYYIDSVPFGLVRSAIAPDQNVYDLQRVEVLRGPQGTLYGASALNGVVRVLTNDADLHSFDVKVRGSDSGTDGGGNNYRGDVAVNVPIVEGKVAARAVVGYEHDSGWIDTPLKNDVNDAELRNYRLKINAEPTDQVSIGLSLWSARDKYGAPSTAGDNGKNASVLNQPIKTDFDAYAVKLGYSFSGYSLSSATSYLKYRDDANFDFTSLAHFPIEFFTGIDSNVLSEEILLNSPGDGAWRWSVGGMYRRATEGLFQYLSSLGPAQGFLLAQDDTSRSFAGFGQITRMFLDGRLEATAGLRQFEDHVTQEGHLAPAAPLVHSEGRFHATTPRAVLTWHANENLMIYGSYSQGFRSGFPQIITVPATVPPVNADTLHNYESGAKGGLWSGRVNFDLAVYYMDWKHVQQLLNVPFGNIYTTAVVNGQSASGEGVDIAVTTQPMQGLTLGVNGSWNNLEMDSAVYSGGAVLFHKGDRLTMSPETTAGASAAYAFALGGSGLTGRLSASVNYTSAQSYRANPGGPIVVVGIGDPIVIGRVGMSVESRDHWSATLFVNNVNNERGAVIRPYMVPELTSRVRTRTAGVQLEYHFK